jgi:carboxyl-terminal processing protease
MKHKFTIPYLLVVVTAALLLTSSNDTFYYKVNKSFEIFGSVFRNISSYYVDDIDPEDLMHDGIDGMLSNLDPYTVFVDEENGENLEIMTDGSYVGVGITVGVRDSMLTILDTYDNYSAQKSGIRIGDRIFKVDSVIVLNSESDVLRKYTKGKIGTPLDMWLLRDGIKDTIHVTMKREEIRIKNVPYYGMLNDSIGYIKLDRFSRNSKDEMISAYNDLNVKNNLKGLVLDLRDNPGGLLESAVSISEIFVPYGSRIVSIKGRNKMEARTYYSDTPPIDSTLPLAVLINSKSASASEILAGAIQDLDRGIIVGERSFGKGLVQSVFDMPYNTSLKITTARYYTPSGRCIQRFEFHNKLKSNIVHSDTTFFTKNKRKVFESNGIMPDSVIHDKYFSNFVNQLIDKETFFNFVSNFTSNMNNLPEDFKVDKTVLLKFSDYLKEPAVNIQDPINIKINELEKSIKDENMHDNLMKKIAEIKKILQKDKFNPVLAHSKEISKILDYEIKRRFVSEGQMIANNLKDDDYVKTAMSLMNSNMYIKMLALSGKTGKIEN